ncbi:MAG: ABC transporter substrate-binding protein [Betaproteobacteria bacterium]|nr:ABC transporter substrate-binding protein [Betaproteobacteria bacterium]
MYRPSLIALLVVAATLSALADETAAGTLRWAGRGDLQTADPHAQSNGLTRNLNALVYESLVTRDRQLALVPALATSWQRVDATTWRFRLRPGVRWSDGSPFTADDVVFSYERARSATSPLRAHADAAGTARRIDDRTVEFVTPGPNPVLLEHVATIGIMSRAWCERNRAATPPDDAVGVDSITARQAMGTGPFVLQTRQPDAKTVLARNPHWWGARDRRFEGNVDEVVYTPIPSDAARVAALIAGDVDLVGDPPPHDVPRLRQTPGIEVVAGTEHRIVFLGLDQGRDELLYASVKGRNPFKDPRVREALNRAIDIDAIQRTTMRGLSQPTGALLPSPAQSTPELERRPPFDREAAQRLLAAAGYAGGFEVTLDCPNDRYVNDEKICQAIAAMWSRIGVNTRVNALPWANYLPKLERRDTSAYLLGWDGASPDAIFTLQPVLATWNGRGDGDHNYGRASNPKLDALTARIKVEPDPELRLRMIREALSAHQAETNHIPLHRQVLPWAMRVGVRVPHRADNVVLPHEASVP